MGSSHKRRARLVASVPSRVSEGGRLALFTDGDSYEVGILSAHGVLDQDSLVPTPAAKARDWYNHAAFAGSILGGFDGQELGNVGRLAEYPSREFADLNVHLFLRGDAFLVGHGAPNCPPSRVIDIHPIRRDTAFEHYTMAGFCGVHYQPWPQKAAS